MSDHPKSPINTVLEKLPISQISEPSTIRLGTALGALTEAALHKLGISKILEFNTEQNAELVRNLEKISYKFQDEEKVVPIPIEIAYPVLEKLTYISDTKISDIFINLISAAGHESTANLVHPSLIHVVDQLSPDEALMLQELKDCTSLECIEYGVVDETPKANDYKLTCSNYYCRLFNIENLKFPENCNLYMENLISLGLFTI